MPEFIVFMHGDTLRPESVEAWPAYLASLRERGVFNGGSALGAATCFRKHAATPCPPGAITGYIRVHAKNLTDASSYLVGNPVFEAGGTVEIRQLIAD